MKKHVVDITKLATAAENLCKQQAKWDAEEKERHDAVNMARTLEGFVIQALHVTADSSGVFGVNTDGNKVNYRHDAPKSWGLVWDGFLKPDKLKLITDELRKRLFEAGLTLLRLRYDEAKSQIVFEMIAQHTLTNDEIEEEAEEKAPLVGGMEEFPRVIQDEGPKDGPEKFPTIGKFRGRHDC